MSSRCAFKAYIYHFYAESCTKKGPCVLKKLMLRLFKILLLVILDLGSLYTSLWLMLQVVYEQNITAEFFQLHVYAFSFLFPLWIIIFYIEGLYSLRIRYSGLSIALIRSMNFNAVISFLFFYLLPFFEITPRFNLVVFMLISLVVLFVIRKLAFMILTLQNLKLNVCLVSESDIEKDLKEFFENRPYLGFQILKHMKCFSLEEIPKETHCVVVDRNLFDRKGFRSFVETEVKTKRHLIELSKFYEENTGRIPVSVINSSWILEHCGYKKSRVNLVLKWLMDKLLSSILFILLSLPMLLVSLLVLIFKGRPILYSQIRTGLNNKPYRIYKFRTMVNNAEKKGEAQWADPNDSRVTFLGKILRKTRLDELPQLWNILKGDMSLIGPRPERPEMIENKLEKLTPFYNYRHILKPGVTGWAQVNFRYGYSEEDAMTKLQYDLYYIKNQSLWLDIKILLKTIKTVLGGFGH